MKRGAISWLLLLLPSQPACCLVAVGGEKPKNGGLSHVASRRSLLEEAFVVVVASVSPSVSYAQEEAPPPPRDRGGKPFAPLEALLPATRLKLLVDQAYSLSSKLQSTSDTSVQYEILEEMDNLLAHPTKLFKSRTKSQGRPSTSITQITTGVSSANKEQYRRNRADLSMPNQLAAMLNQADVERQWGMLRYQESKLEESNEMRAAFNYYTSQLEFGDSYLLTASKDDRKRMIRNEELPSLTAVISSDLDVRELFRNDFLTAIEDAKAEISYQLRQPKDSLDTADVVDLMSQAHTACTEWFGLIASQDVQDALDVVSKEKN